jgi:hypothetical protein
MYLKHTDPTVRQIILAAFPDWTGHNVIANITDTIRFHGTNWDDGNRNTYVLVQLNGLCAVPIAEAPYFQESELHTKDHTIPDGFVVVCWTDSRWPHITISGPSSNITPMLPAPSELTRDERIVLVATRSLKASYGGISNYRFNEAKRETGITMERWESAKTVLIEKKFLNKAGAITVDGKNVVGHEQLFNLREERLSA